MPDLHFRSVGIVGFGLMGGSLARDLRGLSVPPSIKAISKDSGELEAGLAEGVLDLAGMGPEEFFPELDLVVYATPLGATLRLLSSHAAFMDPGTLITDLVSLKHPVLEGMKAAGLGERYVGSHPMAGREGAGYSESTTGLFRDARVWLVAEGASKEKQESLEVFWEALGARPAYTQARVHDHRMAWVSHLPQLTGNALGKALEGAGYSREDLGPGGRDMTRLAGSSPEMWEDLFRVMPEGLPDALRALEGALAELRASLESEDAEGVSRIMEETRRWFRGEGWS